VISAKAKAAAAKLGLPVTKASKAMEDPSSVKLAEQKVLDSVAQQAALASEGAVAVPAEASDDVVSPEVPQPSDANLAPEVAESGLPPQVDASQVCPEAGKMGRIDDVKLGPGLHGKVVAVTHAPKPDVFLCRLQSAAGNHAPGNVVLTKNQIAWIADLEQPTPSKKMYLKKPEIYELDHLFQASEFETKSTFVSDSRFASTHMNLGSWIIKREMKDHPNWHKVCQLDPEFIFTTLNQMSEAAEDAAENFCLAVAALETQVKDKELILAPIWGGLLDAEFHWTLLTLQFPLKFPFHRSSPIFGFKETTIIGSFFATWDAFCL